FEGTIVRALVIPVVIAFALGCAVGFGAGSRLAPRPPAPAAGVARYMTGLQKYDGELIWTSYSAYFQEQRINQGDSEGKTRALYDDLRNKGARIDDVTYIGGYQTSKIGYFMYVTRHYRTGEEPIEVVWIFVTDSDGLIDMVI